MEGAGGGNQQLGPTELDAEAAASEVRPTPSRFDGYRLERQLPGGIRARWETVPWHAGAVARSACCPEHMERPSHD